MLLFSQMSNAARKSLELALTRPEFLDCSTFPHLKVDLRYGTTNNLLARDVYGGFQRVLLHKIAAEKLRQACDILGKRHPELSFFVFDALRPRSAQMEFWNLVVGTPQQPFFANPEKGSIHSFGFAIDLSLCDGSNKELDMGTPFDDLTDLAAPAKEEEMLATGRLTHSQVENRKCLRAIMTESGFLPLTHEWWHFDALPPAEVRDQFQQLE